MVLIIGAGLSGLLTAYRLQQKGIPFKILEARPRIGGRINTVYTVNSAPVEMGATWFNDQHQNLRLLLRELEIDAFEQYMKGSVFYQAPNTAEVQELTIPKQSPSYRISGGSSTLIKILSSKLDRKALFLNQNVLEIQCHDKGVKVIADQIFEGTHVVLALPPKLWAKNIVFEPKLPESLASIALQTHTWMEDSIKIALTYSNPFWQDKNRSGALFSNSGPITELYDHSNHDRKYFALCGFVSTAFKSMSNDQRKTAVIHQLETVFGEEATHFIDYTECIWSREKNTFQTSDILLFPHQNNGNPIFEKSFLNTRIFISSAESASENPGYMDGAVFIGNKTAAKIIKAKQREL